MPKIACPACQKAYNIPDQAVGQVATCKCGKKFRLGKRKSATPDGATATPHSKPRPQAKAQPKPKPQPVEAEPAKLNDSFWDEALGGPDATSSSGAGASYTSGLSAPMTPPASTGYSKPATKAKPAPKKKKKKGGGFQWGADWAAVGGGLMTFLVAGGITVGLIVSTGYLFYWPAGIAIIGLFTALKGLIGKEGIW